MRRTAVVAVGLMLSLGAGACTDTLVEPRSTVTGPNVFEDPDAYTAFLARLYAGLSVTGQRGPSGDEGSRDMRSIDEGFGQYLRMYWYLQELPTDEAVLGWVNDACVEDMDRANFNSSCQFINAMYYRGFFQVAMVNEFLRETTDAKLASRGHERFQDEVDQYRAEARFLRALSYWHLVDLFGNVPLVDEDFPIGGTPPEQATRAQVFGFIESELNAIMSELAPIGSAAAGTSMYGRADQGAAQMLLAKLYLNSEAYGLGARYADALAAADAVISSAAYQLDDEYHHLFLADNHTSPEAIFSITHDGTRTQSWGGTTFLVNASIVGDMANTGASRWEGLRLKQEAVAFYPGGTSGSDDRADIIFTSGQDSLVIEIDNQRDGYGFPKFQNITSTGATGSNPTHPDTDFHLFRLADAMLIYAEACFRSGGGACEANAETYVNMIRDRADADGGDVDFDAMTTDQVLDFILDERGRELIWEASRRTDLIRYGLFTGGEYLWAHKGGVPEGTSIPDEYNLYPIPRNEMIANPNMEQNPGY